MMQIDFPFVRSSRVCPLCGESKGAGLVCCWNCYKQWRMRDGNEEAELLIAQADAKLKRVTSPVTKRSM